MAAASERYDLVNDHPQSTSITDVLNRTMIDGKADF